MCGMPLYEYEHMLEWAVVKRHVAEEITLLCDQHHREKTNGLLPPEVVKAADKDPYNLREGASKPYDLHYSGDTCTTEIGSNVFTTRDEGYGTQIVPVYIDGIPILGFVLTDGHLLLNLNLHDEYNEVVMRIVNNRLTYSTTPWDIALVGKTLRIREGFGRFLIEITFETPGKVVVKRGRFLLNGVEMVVSPTHVSIQGTYSVSGGKADNARYGFAVGTYQPRGAAFAMPEVSRY